MIYLFFDFETTGKYADLSAVCEVGMVLWESTAQRVIRANSMVVFTAGEVVWEEEAIKINGITPAYAAMYGTPQDKALRQFMTYAQSADVYAAWNGKAFDFPWWDYWAAKRNGLQMPERLQFDPMVDIQWPKRWPRELFYIAAKHGILNHHAHSGIGDVLTMLELVARHDGRGETCSVCGVCCDMGAILEYAKQPDIWIEGVCAIDDRERVKQKGYHWLPWPLNQTQDGFKKVNKKWIKKIKEGVFDTETQLGVEIGYDVRRLSP